MMMIMTMTTTIISLLLLFQNNLIFLISHLRSPPPSSFSCSFWCVRRNNHPRRRRRRCRRYHYDKLSFTLFLLFRPFLLSLLLLSLINNPNSSIGNISSSNNGSLLSSSSFANAQFFPPPPFPEYACRGQDVDAVSDLNLNQFVSSTWYIHQQAENIYTNSPWNANNNNNNDECVLVNFEIRTEPTSVWGYTINVQFQKASTSNGNVNGDGESSSTTSTTSTFLACASQQDDIVTSGKFSMASSCTAPPVNDFWILAYNEEEGYALVSGGAIQYPIINNNNIFENNNEEWNGLCGTSSLRNDAELWIMTRDSIRNEELITTIREMAVKNFGIAVSIMKNVNHDDCNYNNDDGDGEEEGDGIITCQDQTGTPIPTWFGDKDCNWLTTTRCGYFFCLWYSDICPVSCGVCE